MSVPLQERTHGYEFSGAEYKLLFERENLGYVRFRNQNLGVFYLDPSPFLKDPSNVIYAVKTGEIPPKRTLIRVTVAETSTDYDVIDGMLQTFEIRYITGWETVDPNKLRTSRGLIDREEYLHLITYPIKDRYNINEIADCIGVHTVASPQVADILKGGVNTVVFTTSQKNKKLAKFNRIMSVIPNEFRQIDSPNFYKTTTKNERINLPESQEVSIAYYNANNIPVHIPVAFDAEFKPYSEIKDNVEHNEALIRNYLLDTLLFNPVLLPRHYKRVEVMIYDMLDRITDQKEVPFFQDIGGAIPQLVAAFARITFKSIVTPAELAQSFQAWYSMVSEIMVGQNIEPLNVDQIYRLDSHAETLLKELTLWNDAGIPLTLETVRQNTRVPSLFFEKALEQLRVGGYIYIPNEETIRLITY